MDLVKRLFIAAVIALVAASPASAKRISRSVQAIARVDAPALTLAVAPDTDAPFNALLSDAPNQPIDRDISYERRPGAILITITAR